MGGPCSETGQYNTRCGKCADCVLAAADADEAALSRAIVDASLAVYNPMHGEVSGEWMNACAALRAFRERGSKT